MRKGDVVFRVRGLRFTDLDPNAIAAYLVALRGLLGPCRLVRIRANTVVMRRTAEPTPPTSKEGTP